MRTTLRLDERLMEEAKRYASERGMTLTAVMEEALRAVLMRSKAKPIAKPIRLPTVAGNGPLPGIDLDDTGSLIDAMDNASS